MSDLTNRRVVKLSDLSATSTSKETDGESFESILEEANAKTVENDNTETAQETLEADVLAEEIPSVDEEIDYGVDKEQQESLAEALAALQKEREEQKQQKQQEENYTNSQVSDEVGIIATGTKVLGDIVTDGHLEIHGVVQGSINARGNVNVKGDVYGDISCGKLIIDEGILKINVQAREDIFLGEKARLEGDVRCSRISIQGNVVGDITATELTQIAATATVNGNITTGNISIGMGAVFNGSIKTIS